MALASGAASADEPLPAPPAYGGHNNPITIGMVTKHAKEIP